MTGCGCTSMTSGLTSTRSQPNVMTAGSVNANSRLHLSLLDLVGATGRRYGGVGLMIEHPRTTVTWQSIPEGLEVIRPRSHPDAQRLDDQLDAMLRRLTTLIPMPLSGRIEVTASPPAHRGYGSKTTLLLSILTAIARCNQLTLDRDTLALISGRGGASGVGIHGFHRGGFIIDAGHVPSDRPYGPSSSGVPTKLPLLNAAAPAPPGWLVGLIDPVIGAGASGTDEETLFRTPLATNDVYKAVATVYHGILPAIRSGDIVALGVAMRTLAGVGFKASEIDAQPPSISSIITSCAEHGRVAAGMSSLGPLVFTILEADDVEAREHVTAVAEESGVSVAWTRPASSGRRVRVKRRSNS